MRSAWRGVVRGYAACAQWVLYLALVALAVAVLLPGFSYLREPTQVLAANLRFASVIYIGLAAVLCLYSNYIRILQNRVEAEILPRSSA
ncbi:MAG: hypothetical protein WDO13_17615 [Verrucomicrobiota bacterium]